MAVSLTTTFYDAFVKLLSALDSNKLQKNNDEEVHVKELVAGAVIPIQAGENPKMMEHKEVFFP